MDCARHVEFNKLTEVTSYILRCLMSKLRKQRWKTRDGELLVEDQFKSKTLGEL